MSESLPEVSCENCVAACCKAPTYMQLTADEYKKHGKTMDLRVIVKPTRYAQRVASPRAEGGYLQLRGDSGLFELQSGCANLDEHNRCSIYASRPGCCRDFEVGSSACLRARRDAGLDADRPPIEDEEPPAPDPTARLLKEFFPTRIDAEEKTTSPVRTVVAVKRLELAEVRALVAREARWIGERLSQCDATTWLRRTRCPKWNLGELAAHLVTSQHLAINVLTAAIEGGGAERPRDFRGDRPATVEAFDRATDDVGTALIRITPDTLERDVIIGGNELVAVRDLVQWLAMELAVHGLDLADALGETRHLTTDAVTVVASVLPDALDPGAPPPPATSYILRSLAFELPFTWQNKGWQPEPGPDPCSIEGEAEAVLLFALGRVPFNKSNLVTNRPDRARAFKRHLAGP